MISTYSLPEKYMSKINTKGNKNQNKVNEAKTVENIKYEPVLSQLVL